MSLHAAWKRSCSPVPLTQLAGFIVRKTQGPNRQPSFRLLNETKDYPADTIRAGSEADTAMRALADHYAETGNPARHLRTTRTCSQNHGFET